MNNQKDITQGFVFLQGKLNTATVEDQIRKIGLEPKKTVYIFPGNPDHHTSSSTLFNPKSGAGLATVAADVGLAGIPTLSLPTRDVNSSKDIPPISQTAVADLWQAVGYGFSLALPVRKKDSAGEIFKNSLHGTDVEPSFWGGIVSSGDPGLAEYYLVELERLRSFLAGNSDQKQQILEELKTKFPKAHAAYQVGRNALTSDTPPNWFKPNDQPPSLKKVSDIVIPVIPSATPISEKLSEVIESQASENSASFIKPETASNNPLLEYHKKYNAYLEQEFSRLATLKRPSTFLEIIEIQRQAATNTAEFFANMANQVDTVNPATSQQEYDWGPVVLDNSKPPTISFFTDEKGKIFTDEGHKFAIEARSGKNELNNLQNRHITPIAMLKRHVKKLLLKGRTIEEASKIILDISEIILEGLRKFSNTGEKTIVTREEIITKFFDYFKSNPERLTGDKNKDDLIIVFQRLFSTYAMAPFSALPTEGNTPEPENEMHMVRNALDIFEHYEKKSSEKYALQKKIAKGKLQADNEEVKKSLAENTLTDKELEKIANELFKIFDYKALPSETKKAREEAIFSTTSIKKAPEVQSYFPKPLQEDFEKHAADKLRELTDETAKVSPELQKKMKGKKDVTLFQTKGFIRLPDDIKKSVVTIAKEKNTNIEKVKYNAHAIVDSWRHDDEPLERLYELAARHLGLFFLFTPNLQDEYQTEIISKFLDKVYSDHNARLTTAKIDRAQFGVIMWNKLLDKYPYFYDFQYKPEQRESQFVRESMLEQLTDFYIDNYHENLLAFSVTEEATEELPEFLQKMPFEKIQKDIEAAQVKHQYALDTLSDPNDKIKYLETQLASHTRMQHLLSRKSKEGIKERQLKLLQEELETLNDHTEDEDVSERRDSLERAIKAWQEPLTMASEDLEEKIKTLQQQLETSSKLSILSKYTFELLSINAAKKDITTIKKELEETIGAENNMYFEDALSQSPIEVEKYSKQAHSTIGQFYYGPPSPTPTSEDEDYNPEDSSSSYSSSEDEEDWEIEFDDLSIQKQENLNLPKAMPTLGDGNCAFNAMALGIADLVRANLFSEINVSDSLNHPRAEFYTLLQKKIGLATPTQEAFKLWLKNKSNYQIQTSLAPLMRKFAVDKIRENNEYDTNYKENYETTLLGAFDGFLKGRMAEDDTFVVHNFIKEKFESLNLASLLNLSEADERRDILVHILNWWKDNLNLPDVSAGYLYKWFKDKFDNPTITDQEMYENLLTLIIDKGHAGVSIDHGDFKVIEGYIQDLINWWYTKKNEKQNAKLLQWWRDEGKEQYFNSLSQPASGAWDRQKWASDVEPGALALDLGINLTREKVNYAPAVFGPGNGLISMDKENLLEAETFNFLRDAGFGYEYQSYFRLADNIKNLEDLEKLLNKASDKVFKFLKNFELENGNFYDIGKPIDETSTDPDIFEELRARGLLNKDSGKYYLVTPSKSQIDTALNGLGDNQELKDKIIKHFDPNIPGIIIKHEGGHWTYIRSPNIRKILEHNNVTSQSLSQQQELKDYAETIQAEASLTSIKIESSATEVKMSSSNTLEQKKLIDYLIENNINFKRSELEIHLEPAETQKLISIIKPIMQEAQKTLEKTADILTSLQLATSAPPAKIKKRKYFTDSESEGFASEEDNTWQDSGDEIGHVKKRGKTRHTQSDFTSDKREKRKRKFEGDISTIAVEDYLKSDSEEISDDNSQQSNSIQDIGQTKKRKLEEIDDKKSVHSGTLAEKYMKDTDHSHKWEDFEHKMHEEEIVDTDKFETTPSTGITSSTEMQVELPSIQASTLPNNESASDPIQEEDANNLLHFFNNSTFGKR